MLVMYKVYSLSAKLIITFSMRSFMQFLKIIRSCFKHLLGHFNISGLKIDFSIQIFEEFLESKNFGIKKLRELCAELSDTQSKFQ